MKPSSPTPSTDTSSTDKPTPAEASTAQAGNASDLPAGGKILPPNSPVDVPRMPHAVPLPTEQPDLSDPHGHTSSWADSTGADPHKKTARTSINNG